MRTNVVELTLVRTNVVEKNAVQGPSRTNSSERIPAHYDRPGYAFLDVTPRKMRLEELPGHLKRDLQVQIDRRVSRWKGGKGCLVIGRLQVQGQESPTDVASWAWLNDDGTFTAAVYPGRSIVFSKHGYEVVEISVPYANVLMDKTAVYDFGTVTMRRLHQREFRTVAFDLELPSGIGKADAELMIDNNFPVGDDWGTIGRERTSARALRRSCSAGERVSFSGCSFSRYRLKITARNCPDYSVTLSDKEEKLAPVKLMRTKRAVFSIRQKAGGDWKRQTVLVDAKHALIVKDGPDEWGNRDARLHLDPYKSDAGVGIHFGFGPVCYDDYGEVSSKDFDSRMAAGLMSDPLKLRYPFEFLPGHVYRMQEKHWKLDVFISFDSYADRVEAAASDPDSDGQQEKRGTIGDDGLTSISIHSGWLDDLDAAKAQAKREGKQILAAKIAEERATLPKVSKSDFKAKLVGVAVVSSKDLWNANVDFSPPETHLEVPFGKIALFKVEYDFPDGYEARVWTRDQWPADQRRNSSYFGSNPSGFYKGKGVTTGFLSLLDRGKSCHLKSLVIRSASKPEIDDDTREWILSTTPVDIEFKDKADAERERCEASDDRGGKIHPAKGFDPAALADPDATRRTQKAFDVLFPGWKVSEIEPTDAAWAAGYQKNWRGRNNVVTTEPASMETPCVLSRRMKLDMRHPVLALEVASCGGDVDFLLSVRVNGKTALPPRLVCTPDIEPYERILVPLLKWQGKEVLIEIVHDSNNRYYEHAFWSKIDIFEGSGNEKAGPVGIDSHRMLIRAGNPKRSPWAYTEVEPRGNWTSLEFDDSRWRKTKKALGRDKGSNMAVADLWKSDRLWVRRKFKLKSSQPVYKAFFDLFSDQDAEIYLNGRLVFEQHGWNETWVPHAAYTEAFARALRLGDNVIAATVKGDGASFFDTGLTIETWNRDMQGWREERATRQEEEERATFRWLTEVKDAQSAARILALATPGDLTGRQSDRLRSYFACCRKGMSIDCMANRNLQTQNLGSYDLVFLWSRAPKNRYSPEERKTLERYMTSGGNVIVLAQNRDGPQGDLLWEFGFIVGRRDSGNPLRAVCPGLESCIVNWRATGHGYSMGAGRLWHPMVIGDAEETDVVMSMRHVGKGKMFFVGSGTRDSWAGDEKNRKWWSKVLHGCGISVQ